MAHAALYSDIINLPHHVSRKRPQMSNYQRAAQFAPFWALNGHEAMVRETERYVDSFTELAGDQIYQINLALCEIAETIETQPCVYLTYYEPDSRKPGGRYIDFYGKISWIDRERQTLSLIDGPTITFEQIQTIQL